MRNSKNIISEDLGKQKRVINKVGSKEEQKAIHEIKKLIKKKGIHPNF